MGECDIEVARKKRLCRAYGSVYRPVLRLARWVSWSARRMVGSEEKRNRKERLRERREVRCGGVWSVL